MGTELPCDGADKALFAASTSVAISDGARASFWLSPWISQGYLSQQFPRLFSYSRRKNRSVREALSDDTWIRDLAHGNNRHLLPDVLALHHLLQGTDAQLQPGVPDDLSWSRASSGKYTAWSAYLAQFQGRTATHFDRLVWKAWAPPKVKFFAWLTL